MESENSRIVSQLIGTNRERFAFLPTPIHELKNLRKTFTDPHGEDGPRIFIKRDDLTGLAFGGNKTRKLEFLIKEALDYKYDTVITVGCPQSNHCRQTAAACVLYKLPCYLVLVGKKEEYTLEGNILLDLKLGAEIILVESESESNLMINNLIEKLKNDGKNPYFIPAGGSNPVGLLGYAMAYKEILNDEKNLNIKFDYIIFASSSLGTQSGLIVGKKVFNPGNTNQNIYGISVCKSFLDSESKFTPERKIINLIEEFNDKYKTNIKVSEEEMIFDQRFNETGYAVLSEDDRRAMEIFIKTEAIFLDPVYSARAAAGMIKMIENGEIDKNCNILFIHTGGGPALFVKNLNN
jgi:D-cysteine desulfhydrase family pyridoxal phosphate-dependent enzyme